MANFTWEDDDELDGAWDRIEAAAPPPLPDGQVAETAVSTVKDRRVRRRFWFAITAVACVFGAIAWVLQSRVNQINAQLVEKVLSSQQLLETALQENDTELFVSVLSGNNSEWANIQIDRFEEGEFVNRNFLGFQAILSTNNETPLVDLDPNLTEAEVTTRQAYEDVLGNRFMLEQLNIFRPGSSRWLLANPDEDYFGSWQTIETDGSITIWHKELDKQVADLFSRQFPKDLARFCALGYNCDPSKPIQVRFTNDAVVLNSDFPKIVETTAGIVLVAPSPTLLGQPIDEAGLEALSKGYTRYLLTAIMHDTWGYTCCDQAKPMIETLQNQQLAELGLHPSPYQADDYAQYFITPFPFSTSPINAEILSTPEAWQSRLLVQYLLEEKGISPAVLGQQFVDANLNLNWLANIATDSTLDFSRFIYSNYDPAVVEQRPSQHIATVCTDIDQDSTTAFTYTTSENSWSSNATIEGWSSLYIANNDTQRVRSLNTVQDLAEQTILYYDDATSPNPISSNDYSQQRWFVVDEFTKPDHVGFISISRSQVNPLYHEIDTQNCSSTSCPIKTYPELPTWSADEIHYLSIQPNGDLVLANTEDGTRVQFGRNLHAQHMIATWGYAWLNTQQFIYQKPDESYENFTFTQYDIETGGETPLFLWSDVINSVTEDISETTFEALQWRVLQTYVVPEQENVLFMQVVNDLNRSTYFIFIDWATGEVLSTIPNMSTFGTALFANNGRWLLWESSNSESNYLIDLETLQLKETFPPISNAIYESYYNNFDWSADGEWLLHLNHGYMTFIKPSENLYLPIFYPDELTTCNGGGFVHPNMP